MLNTKEIEVLQAIALGKTDKEIADSFFVSKRAIEQRIFIVKSKLSATNRANLIYLACKEGILQWPKE